MEIFKTGAYGMKKVLLIKGGNYENLIFNDLERLEKKLKEFGYVLEYNTPDGLIGSWTLPQKKEYDDIVVVVVGLNGEISKSRFILKL
jgi:hypothetical protein